MGVVSVDMKELEQFANRLRKLREVDQRVFLESATTDAALRLLALVIPRTPVGTYSNVTYKRKVSGYKGGTETVSRIHQGGDLRKAWDANYKTVGHVDVSGTPSRRTYHVDVTNATNYASYVESGHRQTPGRYVPAIGKRLKKKWVDGQFFLRKSEDELKAIMPSILNQKLDDFLSDVF